MSAPDRHPTSLEGYLPCRLTSLTVRLPESYARVLLTTEAKPASNLEIPIALEQARQLALAISKEKAPRPLIGDLVTEIMTSYGLQIPYVAITGIADGNVLAEMATVASDGKVRTFPARPSDALIIGFLQPVAAPILVAPELFELVASKG